MFTFCYKWEQPKTIAEIIWNEFWPANVLGADVEKHIRKDSQRIVNLFILQITSATIFLSMTTIVPLTSSTRVLPSTLWYPFDWSKSPVYEILYILQTYTYAYFTFNLVSGCDFFYCAACANCITQFRLLCQTIQFIGTGKEYGLLDSLFKLPGNKYQPPRNEKYRNEKTLMVICVKHHQKIIR